MKGVQIIRKNAYNLVKVEGFLDAKTPESRQLLEVLEMPIEKMSVDYVFDLERVEYINSSMLGAFVQFLSTAEQALHRIIIYNPPFSVENVLNMTGLCELLPVVRSEAEILNHLRQAPEKKLPAGEVKYDVLADEIEAIIRGDTPTEENGGELGRLLGQ